MTALAKTTHISSGIMDFSPVSLADLEAEAALLTRVDRKYVVPSHVLGRLYSRLPGSTRVLQIAGERRFGYKSIYWDTMDLTSFRLSARGRRRRFKVRTRTYLDSGASFLEVKTRGARKQTVKERITHDGTGPALDASGADFVAGRLRAAHVDDIDASALTPSLLTCYRRRTLVVPDRLSHSRITIDTDLSWSLPGAAGGVSATGLAIVETKSGSAPSPVDRTLWRLGYRPVRISKYGTGLCLVRNDLPNLKWHNVIQRNFATDQTN